MKLSIIVPVYNMAGDGKLNFCLDSLVAQDFDGDYEIICVDDCSTDDSMRVLREYEEKYPGLFVIAKNDRNRHQGGARNKGIELASGEWIGFIDSDDWIDPDTVEKLVGCARETDADIVVYDFWKEYSEEDAHRRNKDVRLAARRNRERAVRMNLRYAMFMALLVAGMTAVLICYIKLKSDISAGNREIAQLESTLTEMRASNDEIYNQLHSDVDLEEIRRIAVDE